MGLFGKQNSNGSEKDAAQIYAISIKMALESYPIISNGAECIHLSVPNYIMDNIKKLVLIISDNFSNKERIVAVTNSSSYASEDANPDTDMPLYSMPSMIIKLEDGFHLLNDLSFLDNGDAKRCCIALREWLIKNLIARGFTQDIIDALETSFMESVTSEDVEEAIAEADKEEDNGGNIALADKPKTTLQQIDNSYKISIVKDNYYDTNNIVVVTEAEAKEIANTYWDYCIDKLGLKRHDINQIIELLNDIRDAVIDESFFGVYDKFGYRPSYKTLFENCTCLNISLYYKHNEEYELLDCVTLFYNDDNYRWEWYHTMDVAGVHSFSQKSWNTLMNPKYNQKEGIFFSLNTVIGTYNAGMRYADKFYHTVKNLIPSDVAYGKLEDIMCNAINIISVSLTQYLLLKQHDYFKMSTNDNRIPLTTIEDYNVSEFLSGLELAIHKRYMSIDDIKDMENMISEEMYSQEDYECNEFDRLDMNHLCVSFFNNDVSFFVNGKSKLYVKRSGVISVPFNVFRITRGEYAIMKIHNRNSRCTYDIYKSMINACKYCSTRTEEDIDAEFEEEEKLNYCES